MPTKTGPRARLPQFLSMPAGRLMNVLKKEVD